jgi:hypothetical protein
LITDDRLFGGKKSVFRSKITIFGMDPYDLIKFNLFGSSELSIAPLSNLLQRERLARLDHFILDTLVFLVNVRRRMGEGTLEKPAIS